MFHFEPRENKKWGIVYIIKANGYGIFKYGATGNPDVRLRIVCAQKKWERTYGGDLKFENIFSMCIEDHFGMENTFKDMLHCHSEKDPEYTILSGEFFMIENPERINIMINKMITSIQGEKLLPENNDSYIITKENICANENHDDDDDYGKNKVYSMPEIVKVLNYPSSKIREELNSGRLKGFNVGTGKNKNWRVRESALNEFMKVGD